jgi:hypothetical protein
MYYPDENIANGISGGGSDIGGAIGGLFGGGADAGGGAAGVMSAIAPFMKARQTDNKDVNQVMGAVSSVGSLLTPVLGPGAGIASQVANKGIQTGYDFYKGVDTLLNQTYRKPLQQVRGNFSSRVNAPENVYDGPETGSSLLKGFGSLAQGDIGGFFRGIADSIAAKNIRKDFERQKHQVNMDAFYNNLGFNAQRQNNAYYGRQAAAVNRNMYRNAGRVNTGGIDPSVAQFL